MLFASFKILLNPLLLPAMIFSGGFVAFKLATPKCDPIPNNAHMFVLTGDARRIPFALEQLENHPKRRLYIIGAGTPALDTKFAQRIEIENQSKTTSENAVAIRHIVLAKMLSEIVVITTMDHINRSLFLIKKKMPHVKINACGVPLTKMPATKRLERWLEEYVKFIGTIIGISNRA
ncbi:MAG: YdcF family protein [Rickettsiales bacterium]|jgi:uncharacterized SAM-binding protein YcdF (DUF218 family)|nr:YdcF family protein [Rickettsiales bacterium]